MALFDWDEMRWRGEELWTLAGLFGVCLFVYLLRLTMREERFGIWKPQQSTSRQRAGIRLLQNLTSFAIDYGHAPPAMALDHISYNTTPTLQKLASRQVRRNLKYANLYVSYTT
jgi:hypothetical protein